MNKRSIKNLTNNKLVSPIFFLLNNTTESDDYEGGPATPRHQFTGERDHRLWTTPTVSSLKLPSHHFKCFKNFKTFPLSE